MFDEHDVLLTPVTPAPAPEIGACEGLGWVRTALASSATVPYAACWNMTGQPAVSLPLHWTPGGLPVGVQLVAPYGREDMLIRVASQLEQAAPWSGRRPPVHA